MKKYLITATVIACGLLLIGAAQNNRPQWEYARYGEILGKYHWENGQDKFIGTKEEIRVLIGCPKDKYSTIEFLNYAGKEGWELCNMISDYNQPNTYYYFKRPK